MPAEAALLPGLSTCTGRGRLSNPARSHPLLGAILRPGLVGTSWPGNSLATRMQHLPRPWPRCLQPPAPPGLLYCKGPEVQGTTLAEARMTLCACCLGRVAGPGKEAA